MGKFFHYRNANPRPIVGDDPQDGGRGFLVCALSACVGFPAVLISAWLWIWSIFVTAPLLVVLTIWALESIENYGTPERSARRGESE